MKRILIFILTGLLVMSLSAGVAWAKPNGVPANEQAKDKVQKMQQLREEFKTKVQSGEIEKGVKFKDIDNHWANGPIQNMTAIELFAGYEDGTFKPGNNIKQVELVALIMRLVESSNNDDIDLEGELSSVYESVYVEGELAKVPGWAKNSVQEAVYQDVINLNRFNSHEQATRAQASIWLAKALFTADEIEDVDLDDIKFTDLREGIADFSDEELEELQCMVLLSNNELIRGMPNGQFNPNKPITRAEMAAILDRLITNYDDIDWEELVDDNDYE